MDKDYTILINKKHPLPADFIPEHLIDIGLPFDAIPGDQKRLLEEKTARAALELIARSRMEDLSLYCISGYRSYIRQKELYTGNNYVASPGTSEHQSGLALDLSCPAVHMELTEAFAETKEGLWLKKHAPLYGFIIRYPENKTHITGFPWEPWHIRYVTRPLASYLTLTGLTLEEYHMMENSVDFLSLK